MVIDPKRVKEIFLEAAELSDEAARTLYLDKACGGDAGLRERVEALLRSHDPEGSFLGTPAAVVPDPEHGATQALTGAPDPGVAVAQTTDGENGASDDEPLTFLAPPTRPDALGRIGHYEVLQVLGKGGFGIVFRAFDEMLQRVVALKVLAPQLAATSPARKRFLREARSSAQVRHENVVQVYEVTEEPLPYLAMEFIPGETLQQKLDRVGPLDVPETLRIGRQIAEGLAAAHATDLIHRDIKPGNVLLERGHQKVKITDFGLARAADDASISQSGIIAGTPMYMAPEQANGDKLDQRADLFSLGSVLYQMVSGRPPFRANTTVAVLKRVAEDRPRAIREIIPETPQWLCDIIAKLHAKDPNDRYQSAREVADVLADCEAQLKANAKLKDYSRIPRSKSQRSGRTKWVAAAAFLLLPVIALAVTEFAGVTHLFRREQPKLNPIKPGGEATPGPVTNSDPLPPTYKNSIGMEFVIVPKGKSWLGGGKDKLGDKEVEIPADFYLGKYEVTQEEWEKVMGENPSHFSRTGGGTGKVKDIPDADLQRFPVERVSWDDCQAFVAKLNQREKESGWIYRLPTSTEWEYACRGGPMLKKTDSAFDFYFAEPTNSLLPEKANFGNDEGLMRTSPVTQYEANRLGLHNMHGNLWEWCNDPEIEIDGTAHRVLLGGAWTKAPERCTARFRDPCPSRDRLSDIGLRLARVPAGVSSAKAKSPATDPDRRAAEYVLSVGGGVGVNGHWIGLGDLPRGPFQLTSASLTGKRKVTDGNLAIFKGCQSLVGLDLAGTSVTDAGLLQLKSCHSLTDLNVDSAPITDAGLAHFKDYKALKNLLVMNTGVTDAGLAHLAGLTNLNRLVVNGTKVTDAGLAHLAKMTNLSELGVNGTKVTAEGVERLAKALPKCKIEWDGGLIEPTAGVDPDRRAAEYVLSIGGSVRVDGNDPVIQAKGDLPAGAFQLTAVGLSENRQVTDAGLAAFKDCKNVTWLDLYGCGQITGTGLAHFKNCNNLSIFNCEGVQVTDAALALFAGYKDLMFLNLGNTQVTDGGLVHLKGCKKLKSIGFQNRPVTDAGLAHLKECKGLMQLWLRGTRVTDAGLAYFKDCKDLTLLDLRDTSITNGGLGALKEWKQLTELHLSNTSFTDAGLTHLKGMPLRVLSIDNTGITDLTPLQGMPLVSLFVTPKKITKGLEILKGMKSLETIGVAEHQAWPAAEFWERYGKGEFK